MFWRLVDKLLGIPEFPEIPSPGPEIREPPSWDTPLDQTISIWSVEGETLEKKP